MGIIKLHVTVRNIIEKGRYYVIDVAETNQQFRLSKDCLSNLPEILEFLIDSSKHGYQMTILCHKTSKYFDIYQVSKTPYIRYQPLNDDDEWFIVQTGSSFLPTTK